MTEKNIQEQILELNRKLDYIMECAEQQKRSHEEINDLVSDVNIIAKDAFHHAVVMLDKAQVEVDHCGLPMLFIKVMQNISTFHEMLDMMNSARDLIKDVSPIVHQIGLDAVHKMNELEQKGYFAFLEGMMRVMDRFVGAFTAEDMRNLENHADDIVGIVRNLTRPEFMAALNRTSKALSETSMDEKLDNKSLFGIMKQLNSPDVRRTLSYSLRLIEAMGKENKNKS